MFGLPSADYYIIVLIQRYENPISRASVYLYILPITTVYMMNYLVFGMNCHLTKLTSFCKLYNKYTNKFSL